MDNATLTETEERIKYSKFLSSLFCTTAIVSLSILCLLNNLSLDVYSMVTLLKVVIPAAICFWFLGFVIGKILDGFSKKIVKEVKVQAEKAYEIPSMFAGVEETSDDEFGVL